MGRWRVNVPGEIAAAQATLYPLSVELLSAWDRGTTVEEIRLLEEQWRKRRRLVRQRIVYLERLQRRRKGPG
jgi:hypothetical protein